MKQYVIELRLFDDRIIYIIKGDMFVCLFVCHDLCSVCTKLGWRKFRRRINEFIATLAEFLPVMILLDRRDLAGIANLAQLIPASSLPMLQVLLPSTVF